METLSTPARTVFSVLKASRQLKVREHAEYMHDMISVVCAPVSSKYLEEIKRFWSEVMNDAIPEFKEARVSYSSAGTPTIPWKQATTLMMQQMGVMRKVNHGR